MGYRLLFKNRFQKLSLVADFTENSVMVTLLFKALKFSLLGILPCRGDEVCEGFSILNG